MRSIGRIVPAVLSAFLLAACGGGGSGSGTGSGGGDGSDGSGSAIPCEAQFSQGDGYAIGSCLATLTNVFQPVVADVTVQNAGYILTLHAPASLPKVAVDPVAFTMAANQTPDAREQNMIGVLKGQAYESPLRQKLEPPYIALVDFVHSLDYKSGDVVLDLTYASFGTWEQFPGTGPEGGFNEGYLGVWYAPRPKATSSLPPNETAEYRGQVAGIIATDGSGRALSDYGGRFGFSSPIDLRVDAQGIASAETGDFTITFKRAPDSDLEEAEVQVKPVVFVRSVGLPGDRVSGGLSEGRGQPGDAGITSGQYEARFFGAQGHDGDEIAGLIRFTTKNGLVAVGAFGASRCPAAGC